MNEPSQPASDKDIELVKVQIFAEHIDVEYWSFLSIIYGALLVVIVALLSFTGPESNPLLVTLGAVVMVVIVVTVGVNVVGGKYNRDLPRVSQYLDDIQNGKSLPSLTDIMKAGKGR